MKKLLALALAIMLVAALGLSAAAVDTTVKPTQSGVTITVKGMLDGWASFDLGQIFGTPGSGPFSYGLFFGSGGTVSFDKAVQLSYQGTSTKDVAAGTSVKVTDINEYALMLDDGNSVVFVDQATAPNWGAIPNDQAMSTFPGSVGGGAAAPAPRPRTADGLDVALWTIVGLAAVGGIAVVAFRRSRAQH